MKIKQAIDRINSLVHNTYTDSEKINWLSNMDMIVKTHIIDNYEGSENFVFGGYKDDVDMETELLVPAPFDDVYLKWMEAQIHYYDGEYNKYNNSILMYNAAFSAYANHYIASHKPIRKGNRFLF